jgi:glycine/D-amino acid oxidase-like deaminating enzyme
MSQIIVIGGGVVGLTSAWWLLEAGHRVTSARARPEVGSMASYGNGGQLSYRYVSPLADAGVPLKALQWLFQEHGPLRFKPEFDLRQWTLAGASSANCTAPRQPHHRQAAELGELSRRHEAARRHRGPAARRFRLARRRQAGGVPLQQAPVRARPARPTAGDRSLERRRMRATRAGAGRALAAGRRHLSTAAKRWPTATPSAWRWPSACAPTRAFRVWYRPTTRSFRRGGKVSRPRHSDRRHRRRRLRAGGRHPEPQPGGHAGI